MFLANDASRNPHPDIASFASLGKAIGSQSSVNPWYNGMSRMTRMSKCLGAGNDRNRMSRPSKGIGGGKSTKLMTATTEWATSEKIQGVFGFL